MNTSISTTNLNVRTKNALHGAGIHTVEQLKVTPFEQLKRIRNMGKKSLADIEDFLQEDEDFLQEDEDSQPLMASQATLRDYFAIHAPQEPYESFEPVMKNPRPEEVLTDYQKELLSHERLDYRNWSFENQEDLNAWDAEYERERYLQWPWAYADAMLKTREQ